VKAFAVLYGDFCWGLTSGTSATTTTTTASAAKSGETTEIVFWQLDGPTWMPLYKDLIKKFEDSHPDIKVKMTNIPEEGYFEKLNTAFAAGKGPDMWGGCIPRMNLTAVISQISTRSSKKTDWI
jgi:ABC-type glycerol-3-phosphate transport system substrate-binding protein